MYLICSRIDNIGSGIIQNHITATFLLHLFRKKRESASSTQTVNVITWKKRRLFFTVKNKLTKPSLYIKNFEIIPLNSHTYTPTQTNAEYWNNSHQKKKRWKKEINSQKSKKMIDWSDVFSYSTNRTSLIPFFCNEMVIIIIWINKCFEM